MSLYYQLTIVESNNKHVCHLEEEDIRAMLFMYGVDDNIPMPLAGSMVALRSNGGRSLFVQRRM